MRRKTNRPPRKAKTDDGSSDSEGASDLDEAQFAAGGPTNWHGSPTSKKPGVSRRRNRHERDENIPESVLEERRNARRKAESERVKKIKSALYVSKSLI